MNNLIDLSKLIKELEEERKRVLNRLNEINKEISAATLLKNSRAKLNEGKRPEPIVYEYQEIVDYVRTQRKRHQMTQIQAVKEIGRRTEDNLKQFKLNVVKKIMVAAGFFKTPGNASSILYTIMERSGQFEKIEPGVYKIKDVKGEGQ